MVNSSPPINTLMGDPLYGCDKRKPLDRTIQGRPRGCEERIYEKVVHRPSSLSAKPPKTLIRGATQKKRQRIGFTQEKLPPKKGAVINPRKNEQNLR